MTIVLNEYEWAEKMINDHDLGKRPVETLGRVAKYYYANKYSKREIRKKLNAFLLQCDPYVSLVQWSDTIERVIKNAKKYPLIVLDGVVVTKKELLCIEALKGRQLQRLAFVLLCVAKYWDAVNPKNNHWANISDRDAMRMANINTSIKRQSALFGELHRAGFIRFSRKIDSLNVQVKYIKDGKTAMYIQDFRNLGYQYLKYYGGPYFECANCGIVTKYQNLSRRGGFVRGRRQKYCPSCAAEVQAKQAVNAAMRSKERLKEKQPAC